MKIFEDGGVMDKVLLIIEHELEILKDWSHILIDLGYKCLTAKSGKEAVDVVRRAHPDVVINNKNIPYNDGFEVLRAIKKIAPDIPIIIFSEYGSVESAVQAMKLGAYDYIQQPISPKILEIMLKKAIDYRKLTKENLDLKTQFTESYKLDNHVICKSHTMTDIAKRVLKIAKTDADVLIYGETGTGKEMIAQNIHLHSSRKDMPFIPLDCVALPATLLESEIFGFEKGAFTGAIKSKPGMLELADGGILFLDEIVELEPGLQAKLLRVLQERQFRRIGGTKFIDVNIRIISATNKNPEKAVEEKKLREDLYYRLNVVRIFMPPLRKRKEDIPFLVHHFIKELNPSSPIEIKGISDDAMKCLKKYYWPGNVRELKNVIKQAISLAEKDLICLEDLPENIRANHNYFADESLQSMNFKEAKQKYLRQFSKLYFDNLLKKYEGNISEVARKAGISRKTIYRILNKIDNTQ